MSKPVWVTPKGFLFTATENVYTTFNVSVTGTDISFQLLNGQLPNGIEFTNSGTFLGTPTMVLDNTTSTFTIRASNNEGINDRSFNITVIGPDNPIWITTPGILNIGPNGENYLVNGQFINYQLMALSDIGTINYKLISGELPNTLELKNNGLIQGFVNDFVASGSLNFDFIISASNGVSSSTSSFRIILFRTAPNDLISLQWLNNGNLGVIKSNQNHIIDILLHDPRPNVGTLAFSLTTGTLPPNLVLNTQSGYISGYVVESLDKKENYIFDITAIKTINNNTTSTTQTFELSVLKVNNDDLLWVNTGSLGDVLVGKPVTLQVQTIENLLSSSNSSKYKLKTGTLPPGIELTYDGLIAGIVPTNTATSTEIITYDFEINGLDSNNNILSTGTFSVTTVQNTSTEFTRVYCKPYLTIDKRNLYKNLINNSTIFNPSWIYRKSDTNFGILPEFKIIVDFGLSVENLYNYYTIIEDKFYKRKFQLGKIKVLPYENIYKEIIYEMVFFELSNQFGNDLSKKLNARDADVTKLNMYDLPIDDGFVSTSTNTYYNSIENIRYSLQKELKFTNQLNPDFLNTWSLENNTLENYFVYVPICYAQPGKGMLIKNRLDDCGVDFKLFDIEIDRIIIENTSR